MRTAPTTYALVSTDKTEEEEEDPTNRNQYYFGRETYLCISGPPCPPSLSQPATLATGDWEEGGWDLDQGGKSGSMEREGRAEATRQGTAGTHALTNGPHPATGRATSALSAHAHDYA
jgi:hypothetical protein